MKKNDFTAASKNSKSMHEDGVDLKPEAGGNSHDDEKDGLAASDEPTQEESGSGQDA